MHAQGEGGVPTFLLDVGVEGSADRIGLHRLQRLAWTAIGAPRNACTICRFSCLLFLFLFNIASLVVAGGTSDSNSDLAIDDGVSISLPLGVRLVNVPVDAAQVDSRQVLVNNMWAEPVQESASGMLSLRHTQPWLSAAACCNVSEFS
jgi:hypothetical protein